MADQLTPEQEAKRQLDTFRYAYKAADGKYYSVSREGQRVEAIIGSTLADGSKVEPLSPKYQEIAEKTGALVMTLSNVMEPLTEDQRGWLKKYMDSAESLSNDTNQVFKDIADKLGFNDKSPSALESLPGGAGEAFKNARTAAEFLEAFKSAFKVPVEAAQSLWGFSANAIDQIRLSEITEENATAIATAYASARQSAADSRKDVSYVKGLFSGGWLDYLSAGFSKLLDFASSAIIVVISFVCGLLENVEWMGIGAMAKDFSAWVKGNIGREGKSLAQHVDEASIGRDNTRTGQAISTYESIGGLDGKTVAATLTKGSKEGTLDRNGHAVVVAPASASNLVPTVLNPKTGKPIPPAPTIAEQARTNASTPIPSLPERLNNVGSGLVAMAEQIKEGAANNPVAAAAGVVIGAKVLQGAADRTRYAFVAKPEAKAEKLAGQAAELEQKIKRLGRQQPGGLFGSSQEKIDRKIVAAQEDLAKVKVAEAKYSERAVGRAPQGSEWHNRTHDVFGKPLAEPVHTKGNLGQTVSKPLSAWNPLHWPRLAGRAVTAPFASVVETSWNATRTSWNALGEIGTTTPKAAPTAPTPAAAPAPAASTGGTPPAAPPSASAAAAPTPPVAPAPAAASPVVTTTTSGTSANAASSISGVPAAAAHSPAVPSGASVSGSTGAAPHASASSASTASTATVAAPAIKLPPAPVTMTSGSGSASGSVTFTPAASGAAAAATHASPSAVSNAPARTSMSTATPGLAMNTAVVAFGVNDAINAWDRGDKTRAAVSGTTAALAAADQAARIAPKLIPAAAPASKLIAGKAGPVGMAVVGIYDAGSTIKEDYAALSDADKGNVGRVIEVSAKALDKSVTSTTLGIVTGGLVGGAPKILIEAGDTALRGVPFANNAALKMVAGAVMDKDARENALMATLPGQLGGAIAELEIAKEQSADSLRPSVSNHLKGKEGEAPKLLAYKHLNGLFALCYADKYKELKSENPAMAKRIDDAGEALSKDLDAEAFNNLIVKKAELFAKDPANLEAYANKRIVALTDKKKEVEDNTPWYKQAVGWASQKIAGEMPLNLQDLQIKEVQAAKVELETYRNDWNKYQESLKPKVSAAASVETDPALAPAIIASVEAAKATNASNTAAKARAAATPMLARNVQIGAVMSGGNPSASGNNNPLPMLKPTDAMAALVSIT